MIRALRAARLLAAAVLASTLLACDGQRCSEGVVSDATTQAPLEGVLCRVVWGGEQQVTTDATGHYVVCGYVSPCDTDGCPAIQVEFTKDGYAPVTIQNPADVALDPLP